MSRYPLRLFCKLVRICSYQDSLPLSVTIMAIYPYLGKILNTFGNFIGGLFSFWQKNPNQFAKFYAILWYYGVNGHTLKE